MQCPSCGVEAAPEAVYCHRCGERLDSSSGEYSNSERTVGAEAAPTAALREQFSAGRRDADEAERELWRGGYSPKAMLGGWVLSGAISAALLAAATLWATTALWWLVLLLAALLPWIYHFILLSYRRMSVRYLLTSRRFIHESGILRRETDRIEVLDMDDIKIEQTLLERLVGVGTVRILSSDRSHPELSLPGIENVAAVSRTFDDARLLERRRRGVHIEQI
jgi:membrane protein YdbS with pleckstrin-like domain